MRRVTFGNGQVAIEVDGPAHFSWNVHKPLGSMLIRRRLLKARGWNTISVPYYAWAVVSLPRLVYAIDFDGMILRSCCLGTLSRFPDRRRCP